MSSDSDNSDSELLLLASAYYLMKKNRKRPSCHVNSYLKKRPLNGRFVKDFLDLRDHPQSFKENFRTNPEQFDYLLSLVKAELEPCPRSRGDRICATAKFAVTLEYLASGSLERHIASCYRISKQRLGKIIQATTASIVKSLERLDRIEYTKKFWIEKSNAFNEVWNFPNCLGTIDGKHCQIRCPANGSSMFYNHKKHHSIVLMAVVDAEYKFLNIDVGAYGSEGDSGIFSRCRFGKRLFSNKLNLPSPLVLSGKPTPFVFLADDAFPLHENIMKPFKPTKNQPELTRSQRIFNYRLSRARRCVENAFGIMCARFQCLARTMYCSPDKAQLIVAACCLLHNYLLRTGRSSYAPEGFSDRIDEDGNIVEGSFRKHLKESSLYHTSFTKAKGRLSSSSKSIRDHFCNYFNSPFGKLQWQENIFQAKKKI